MAACILVRLQLPASRSQSFVASLKKSVIIDASEKGLDLSLTSGLVDCHGISIHEVQVDIQEQATLQNNMMEMETYAGTRQESVHQEFGAKVVLPTGHVVKESVSIEVVVIRVFVCGPCRQDGYKQVSVIGHCCPTLC
jgi:hypothetical protein